MPHDADALAGTGAAGDADPGAAGPAGRWPGLVLALLLLSALLAGLRLVQRRAPLDRAWAAVEQAGPLRFEGTSQIRAGQLERRYSVTGEAEGGRLALTLQTGLAAADAPRYRLAWPRAERVDPASDREGLREVEPHALALILPAGDPLALLASAQAQRRGALERVGDRRCRRVDFRIGARAYAAWWAAHPAWWPVNADSGGLQRFTAFGSAWIDPTSDLPCRIALRIELPRLAGERAGVGEMDWRYAAP